MPLSEILGELYSLDGRNALVTGAGSGIGRAAALALAGSGAFVTLCGRRAAALGETAGLIRASGGNCEVRVCDVSSDADIEELFSGYGPERKLDIFINNAGFTVHSGLCDTAAEDIDALIATNLRGAILALQHAARLMRAQKSGVITVITSVNGLNSHPGQGMYSVTKFGLQGAMKALASELAEYGVRVNSIAPGAIDTAMNAAAFADAETLKAVNGKIPMGRVGLPEEIGRVAAAISSDVFSYMTGATVVVDGGMMLKHK